MAASSARPPAPGLGAPPPTGSIRVGGPTGNPHCSHVQPVFTEFTNECTDIVL